MATQEANIHPSLPSYPEMILAAIEALNEKNGSNKTSISKYIEYKYSNLPAEHSSLLSDHLNKMRESGKLVFWKNNYTKFDPSAPPRRGRGRPPKPKSSPPPPHAVALTPSRPRGRPPKDPNAPPKPQAKASAPAGGSGRPRGRPRKMAKPSGGLASGAAAGATKSSESVTNRRGRGRPPKEKPATNEVAS